ncbi:cortical protein marker for cell polarity-domain-containing protein [Fennellomyces sp. T-0311]|nr:cortical protein marker for cell polarity-domain-containing protein [Fennellomyces sp. T-0311]
MSWRVWLRAASILFIVNQITASYIDHPTIDIEQLEQIGIAGAYGGISLYTDTRQLTQIPSNTASVLSFANNTFASLAHSSPNATIYTACYINNILYIGGDFLQFGPLNVSNVAAVDLNSGSVSALANGLDGPVYTLYCDAASDSVYAGGRFMAPVAPAPQYAESLAYFGGGVAAWKDNLWHGLPWKGFNGPVGAITKNGVNGKVLFGGRFDTSADGINYHAPASQPVILSSPAVITAQNSGTVNNNAQSIVCPANLDDDPWLLLDDTEGYWQATFPYSITPSLIRLVNTHQDGRGTKSFTILSLPSNTPFNLSYIDPVTQKRTQCSTNCSLTDDPAILYQDFQVRDSTLSYGIRIEVSSWYGAGGGLSSVEIFQAEIIVYAVNSLNGKACATSMEYKQRSRASVTGSWSTTQLTGSYVYTLSTSIPAAQIRSSTATATFVPYLPETGHYQVYLYNPACTTDCDQRTQVDVTTYRSSSADPVTRNVDLKATAGSTVLVFTGYIHATTDKFQPYVSVAVASNATAPSSGNAIISLQAVQFIKQASNTTLTSLLEFTPAETDTTVANTTLVGQYGPFADNVPYGSTVNALEASDGNVYIGGSFNATAYENIVRLDAATQKLAALQGRGINGGVSSFMRKDNDLYVGGAFTGLAAAGDTSIFNNIVRYSTNDNTWHGMGGGVNGPVEAINLDSDNVIVSGTHTVSYNQVDQTNSGNATAHNAWWSTTTNRWSLDTPYISGRICTAFQMTNGTEATTVYVGDIKAAQRQQSRGFSFMNENTDLSALAVYPNANKPYQITAGTFWGDEKNGNRSATILGGQFEIDETIQNVAIYENETWTGIGASWEGSINIMAVNSGYLYIGGHMNQTWNGTQSGLVVYDLVNKTFTPVPELHTHDRSPSLVHQIGYDSTDGNMIIAGNFSSAGSLQCSGICILDTKNHQWNYLGDGSLGGEALDFTYTGSQLIVAGNLALSGSPVPIAQYDYGSSKWSSFATGLSDEGLPGNSTAVSYDGQSKKTFIAGRTGTGAYLRVWDGKQFIVPEGQLGPDSSIRQLAILPLKETGGSDLMGNDQAVLLATGFLNLGEFGNLSSALYNGTQWIPYLTVAAENGSIDALQSMFFKSYHPHLNGDSYLPAPLVVLVSVAAALGIVFLIVLCAMGVLFAKRRREAKVNPAANPATYYGKPPRRPESLLAMLNSSEAMSGAGAIGGNGGMGGAMAGAGAAAIGAAMYETKKDRGMNDESHNMHALTPPPPSQQQQPEMTQTSTGFGAASALGGIATATAAATAKSRGMNDNSQQQQYNNVGQADTYNNVGQPVTYNTIPAAPVAVASRNSHNPFRQSAVGVAVSDDYPNYASRTPQDFLNAPPDAVTSGVAAGGTPVRWTNAPQAEAASAAIVGPVSMLSTSPSSEANAVRWTNVPTEGPTRAVLGNVSMYSTSSMLIPGDSDSGANVRWTNAGVDSDAAMATALVAPVVAGSNRASDNPQQEQRSMPNDDPSTVRWTNYTTHSVQGVAALRPVTAISMYSDASGYGSTPPAVPEKEGDDVFGAVRPSLLADFSSDPDIVRWTTAPDSETAKGTAVYANVTAKNTSSALIKPSTEPDNRNSNGSASSAGKQALRQYESGLDLASIANWEDNEDKYSGVMTNERSMSNEGSKDAHTGALAAVPSAAKSNESSEKPQESESGIDNRMFKTSSFRWSETPSLPAIDTNFNIGTMNQQNLSPLSSSSPNVDPSVRWKETHAASPIEKGFAPHVAESSAATVTITRPDDDDEDNAAETRTIASQHSTKSNLPPPQSALDGRAASKRMVEDYFSSREPMPKQDDRQSKYHKDFQAAMEAALKNNNDDLPCSEDHPNLYYAKFDFNAREHGELGFDKGDPIIVVDRSDDIWWMGYKDNGDQGPMQGVFPSNYVERASTSS